MISTFYTMNRAKLVYAICHLLGLRSKVNANGNGGVGAAA